MRLLQARMLAVTATLGLATVAGAGYAFAATASPSTAAPSTISPSLPDRFKDVVVTAFPRGGPATGNRSAAAYIASGANSFLGDRSPELDGDPYDYDITYQLVLRVLAAKPDSPVGLLTRGEVPLTLFLPQDGAWRGIAVTTTGDPAVARTPLDATILDAVLSLGIDKVERVLLNHVLLERVPFEDLATNVGGTVTTALGESLRLQSPFRPGNTLTLRIVDNDPESRDAGFGGDVGVNVNTGNKQLVHVITSVLRPRP